jgi:ABC-2 type transport system ATP-binding protein
VIEVIGLTTRYGRATVLDDVTFDIRPGQVTGLIAADGRTDATVLRAMLQLERAAGRTLFDGRRYRALRDPMREVGVLLDVPSSGGHRSARCYARCMAAAGGVSQDRVEQVLELVGLAGSAHQPLSRLTASMARRLGIAVALLGDPAALLLRDPTRGLEPRGVEWLRSFVRAYAGQGRAVLLTGADAELVAGMSEHVVVIEDGQVTANRAADKLTTPLVRLAGERSGVRVTSPQVERLSAALAKEGAVVQRADDTSITVLGVDRARVGELAFTAGVLLHELAELPPDAKDGPEASKAPRQGAANVGVADERDATGDASAESAAPAKPARPHRRELLARLPRRRRAPEPATVGAAIGATTTGAVTELVRLLPSPSLGPNPSDDAPSDPLADTVPDTERPTAARPDAEHESAIGETDHEFVIEVEGATP